MKFLQLCPKVPYPPLDGGAIAMTSLSEGFASQEHDITILAMNTPKHYQYIDKVITNERIQLIGCDVNTRINPLKVLINLLFSRSPYIAQRFISKAYKNKLIQLLTNKQYDIIQLEGLYLLPYINTIRKHSNTKIAFRAHNIEHEIWERSLKDKKGLVRLYLKNMIRRLTKFEKAAINKYDLLVPITQRDLEQFNLFGNIKPAFVTPTGINITTSKDDSINIEYQSLFFIGALDWFPNTEGLLWFMDYIWSDLHSLHPSLPLYIAGRNAPLSMHNKLNRPNVIFLGEIPDAHAFIKTKGIMIVPVFSGSGMRIKIIEGMALGKVIVTTTIGAEGIAVTNNENIVIANSKDEFIDVLNKLLNNWKLYDKICANARKFVTENYDNLKISSRLVEFYKSQLG